MTTALAAATPSPRPPPGPGQDAAAADTTARRKTPHPKLGQDSAKGVFVTGVVLTALSTWSSGMLASRYLDSNSATKRGMGRVLPIPFAGPIAAAAMGGDRMQYPLATLGMIQGAGLSLLTIGAVSMSRHRRLGRPRDVRKRNSSTGALVLTQGVMWLCVSWGMTYGFSRVRAKGGDPFARRLQAPIIGGIWAASRAPNYTRAYLGLTSSAIQMASASAIVFGAVALSRHRKRNTLMVMPVPTPEGGQLVAAMRF